VEQPAPTDRPAPPRRRRDSYKLRVESITYLGDDAAAAKAIENVLRLSRLSDGRQRAEELELDEPGIRTEDGARS
jgi:hypothetical protein